ncbi:MAG: LpxD N-terminal domain-containing protein [Hymenobacter sp.]
MESTGAAGLDIAESGQITFLANPKYTPQIKDNASKRDFFERKGRTSSARDIAVLRAKDPYLAYTRALRLFYPEPEIISFVHPSAVIDETAKVAENVEIQANVVVGKNCVIEDGVKIFPNVTIYDNVKIGKNSTIHSGVSIRENCEIGANCIIHNNSRYRLGRFRLRQRRRKTLAENSANRTRRYRRRCRNRRRNTAIDCASVGETRIKRGAKIDNLVQIGHSCTIEEDALICAQTGLAGSSVIGKRVILAGQVGIAGHLKSRRRRCYYGKISDESRCRKRAK